MQHALGDALLQPIRTAFGAVEYFGTLVDHAAPVSYGGRTDTPLRQKVFWLFAVGGIGVMLLLSGGLGSLQAGAIATGLPLALVLLVMCWGTLRGLLAVHRRQPS